MSTKLLIATRNRGKLREFQALFAAVADVVVLSLDDVANAPEDVVEDGDTFLANATKKAIEVAQATGHLTLADDSGLEVDALQGAPGVHSARFAGSHGDDGANNRLLLERMKNIANENRTARFRCVLVLADPDARGGCKTFSCDGAWEGSIAHEERGTEGFGYDSLFLAVGETRTNGELSADEKNARSHRALAARQMARILAQYLPTRSA